MRRGRILDRDRERNHVRPKGESERAEGGDEDDGDEAKRRLVAAPLEARSQEDRRYDSDGGENEEIRPLEPSVHDRKMLDERKAEHRDQKQEQRERQRWDEPIGKLANVAVALANEPACSEQRVADAQADAAEHREGAQPTEVASDIVAIGDRKTLDQAADCQTLHEGGDERSPGEARIPQPPPALRPMPEFEGDPAQDQPSEHEQERQVEGG